METKFFRKDICTLAYTWIFSFKNDVIEAFAKLKNDIAKAIHLQKQMLQIIQLHQISHKLADQLHFFARTLNSEFDSNSTQLLSYWKRSLRYSGIIEKMEALSYWQTFSTYLISGLYLSCLIIRWQAKKNKKYMQRWRLESASFKFKYHLSSR